MTEGFTHVAEVAVNVPLEKTFHYAVPEKLSGQLDGRIYKRVQVNFNGRKMWGFVLRTLPYEEIREELEEQNIELKFIERVIDNVPIIDRRTVELAEWMRDYYIAPFGEVLFAATPSAQRESRYPIKYDYTGELHPLSEEQQTAFRYITDVIGDYEKRPESPVPQFLIHGITGSGKTEVYKYLVQHVLDQGKSAIILIPEIALTPQTLERFYRSFGKHVAVYHSKLSQGERLGEWMRAMRGEARVMIGPRSAIFAPLRDLGLIIIDEEHETSYKSGNSPRYHARQIAFYRSRVEKAPVVFGSATPQLETYYHAVEGNIHLIELMNRYGNTQMPEVKIVDMREDQHGNNILTEPSVLEIMKTLNMNRQVLIFLNRRGYSPALMCRACGYRFQCPNCDVSTTYHKHDRKLVCHHCEYEQAVPPTCPNCGSADIKEVGTGTEKLESVLLEQFPTARIFRMDLDTTRKKHSYETILQEVKEGNADILVGTQMVAKGHDIAGLHLVVALLPDIILSLPDFRSAERTFTLFTQVIGRAGRRGDRGEALIQTYLPKHFSVTTAVDQDYKRFYAQEIEKRKTFNYPPFIRMGRVVFRSKDASKIGAFIEELRKFVKSEARNWENVQLLGPVTCPMEKLNNQYRYHIIIKSKKVKDIQSAIIAVRDYFKNSAYTRFLFMEIDIDPMNMM